MSDTKDQKDQKQKKEQQTVADAQLAATLGALTDDDAEMLLQIQRKEERLKETPEEKQLREKREKEAKEKKEKERKEKAEKERKEKEENEKKEKKEKENEEKVKEYLHFRKTKSNNVTLTPEQTLDAELWRLSFFYIWVQSRHNENFTDEAVTAMLKAKVDCDGVSAPLEDKKGEQRLAKAKKIAATLYRCIQQLKSEGITAGTITFNDVERVLKSTVISDKPDASELEQIKILFDTMNSPSFDGVMIRSVGNKWLVAASNIARLVSLFSSGKTLISSRNDEKTSVSVQPFAPPSQLFSPETTRRMMAGVPMTPSTDAKSATNLALSSNRMPSSQFSARRSIDSSLFSPSSAQEAKPRTPFTSDLPLNRSPTPIRQNPLDQVKNGLHCNEADKKKVMAIFERAKNRIEAKSSEKPEVILQDYLSLLIEKNILTKTLSATDYDAIFTAITTDLTYGGGNLINDQWAGIFMSVILDPSQLFECYSNALKANESRSAPSSRRT